MKQTAVEWFFYQLYTMEVEYETIMKLLEQAKAMEKEQIKDAYKADCDTLGHTNAFNVAAEQYYNETYESNNRI
jgi:hypothetical protein